MTFVTVVNYKVGIGLGDLRLFFFQLASIKFTAGLLNYNLVGSIKR